MGCPFVVVLVPLLVALLPLLLGLTIDLLGVSLGTFSVWCRAPRVARFSCRTGWFGLCRLIVIMLCVSRLFLWLTVSVRLSVVIGCLVGSTTCRLWLSIRL